MKEWKCSLNELDNDIRELVEIALNNGMQPYMSCSGSYRDHKDKSSIPVCGCIELLDSEYIREVIAILLNNKNFSCKIKKAPKTDFYGNELPEGLRFEIDFENAKGNVGQELKQLFNDVILGRRSLPYDREKVNSICELLSTFDVKDGSQIAFYFNAPKIDVTNPEKDNYAIEINGRKNTQSLINEINNNVDGIEQDEKLCTIYGSDIITMGAVLKKTIIAYPKLSYLGKEKNRRLTLPNREDFLLKQYNSHIDEARIDSDSGNCNIEYFDIDDLFNL